MLSNYPPGAENDPSAPYNEKELPSKSFNITVAHSFSKDFIVETTEYDPFDRVEPDYHQMFENSEHYNIKDLLSIFKGILEKEVLKEENFDLLPYYNHLIEECSNWITDDYEVFES